MKTLKKDLLTVNVYKTRDEMGKSAANDIKACILSLLKTKETINMIFAAAPFFVGAGKRTWSRRDTAKPRL